MSFANAWDDAMQEIFRLNELLKRHRKTIKKLREQIKEMEKKKWRKRNETPLP